MTSEQKSYWLLSRSGDPRSVWGPYTEAEAKREAGNLYHVVKGFREQRTIDRASLLALVQSAAVWSPSGVDLFN